MGEAFCSQLPQGPGGTPWQFVPCTVILLTRVLLPFHHSTALGSFGGTVLTARPAPVLLTHRLLEANLAQLEQAKHLLTQERNRFERQATHLTVKYRAVDVDTYNQLQAEHAELKEQVTGAQAELASQQQQVEQLKEQLAAGQATIDKFRQQKQKLSKQLQELQNQMQQAQVRSWGGTLRGVPFTLVNGNGALSVVNIGCSFALQHCSKILLLRTCFCVAPFREVCSVLCMCAAPAPMEQIHGELSFQLLCCCLLHCLGSQGDGAEQLKRALAEVARLKELNAKNVTAGKAFKETRDKLNEQVAELKKELSQAQEAAASAPAAAAGAATAEVNKVKAELEKYKKHATFLKKRADTADKVCVCVSFERLGLGWGLAVHMFTQPACCSRLGCRLEAT